ncbi:DNA-binding protein [Lacihabitans sp. LS3-19]|nr:DNA-binding protein [Lacihabitans sp. LS3-19]
MALEKVQSLMLKKPDKASLEGQELEMLITLIEAYEDIHFPMSASDPIAYLHFKMQQENLKQKDLIPFIGDKSKVSKVLNKKQELTVLMIKKLSLGLNIPLNYLISLSV